MPSTINSTAGALLYSMSGRASLSQIRSERPFDSSYAIVWKRFSALQYRSFMGTVHDVIRGHANWVDEYGFTLLAPATCPSLGHSRQRLASRHSRQ